MRNLARKLELAANVAIIVVAVLLGVVLVRTYLIRPAPAPAATTARVAAGTKLSLPGVDWSGSRWTLLFALSSNCHFCTDSAEFYRRLTREVSLRGGTRTIAVLPQSPEEGRAYLGRLGLQVDDVRQAALDSVNIASTPTLILVDAEGRVSDSWVGRLPTVKEDEVLATVLGHDNGPE